ncbi:hypothetical protein NVP1101O_086 [Vibrio phage 1.101.O._10N.261.45.C6]|nr:hypothetical protein NVP1101O_086 [Vibrio phage 1.101.O._10N.261.45.C6]
MNKYWVKYSYTYHESDDYEFFSEFITTDDFEGWWDEVTRGCACKYELISVTKL